MSPAATGSETALVNALLIWLRARGAVVWRCNTGAMTIRTPGHRSRFVRFNAPGTSDILGCHVTGRMIAVEAKRPGNEPTPAQRDFLRDLQIVGAFAVCVHSVEELEQAWHNAGLGR